MRWELSDPEVLVLLVAIAVCVVAAVVFSPLAWALVVLGAGRLVMGFVARLKRQ